MTAAPTETVQHSDTDDARRRKTVLDLAATSSESLAELHRAAALIIAYAALSVAETPNVIFPVPMNWKP